LGQIPFSGTTAYQDHYQRHPYEAASLNPELYHLAVPVPEYPQPQRIRFEGESTYKAAYRNSDIMDRMRVLNSEKINRKDYWSQHHTPFIGDSSYKAHFQPFQVQSRQNPPLTLQPHPTRFEGKTTYKSDF
jgi:hypothetical protein